MKERELTLYEERVIVAMNAMTRIGTSIRETYENEEHNAASEKLLRSLACEAASILSSHFAEVGEAVEVFVEAFDTSVHGGEGHREVDPEVIAEEILSCWVFVRAAVAHPGTRPMVSSRARRHFGPRLFRAVTEANLVRAARSIFEHAVPSSEAQNSSRSVN